jgi:hypothetical protein
MKFWWQIFDKPSKPKITPELKTALVLASVTNAWTLGYCYYNKIVSDRETDLILAARRTLEQQSEKK